MVLKGGLRGILNTPKLPITTKKGVTWFKIGALT